MPSYHPYWGKARPAGEGAPPYHLLPYHCLDVVAVASCLWYGSPLLRYSFSRLLGLSQDQARCLLLFLIALHDLGKFADTFQNLAPEVRALLPARQATIKARGIRHDLLGYLCWSKYLSTKPLPGLSATQVRRINPLILAVTGHHGFPPDPGSNPREVFSHFLEEDLLAAECFVQDLARLFPLDLDDWTPNEETLGIVSLYLAGFTMLCDWAGSYQVCFPYETQVLPLETYFARSLNQAQAMMAHVHLLPPAIQSRLDFDQLFAFLPSPLQAEASRFQPEPGPHLFLIEDLTGSGKTEAALYLAHSLLAADQAQGLFFALPTMATADQMYERVSGICTKLFPEKPFLMLAHGARKTNPLFASQLGLEDQIGSVTDGESSESRSAEWLADNAKKALLAPIGVGTVDQCLLAVLRKKHAPMRLFGLLGKVLIIDELHAYDDYMQAILEVLLTLHTQQGGSTLLLSATLSRQQRTSLVRCFQQAVGYDQAVGPLSDAYPLLTHLNASGVPEQLAIPSQASRQIQVRLLDSSPIGLILERIQAGAAVCWIRNSVEDAIEAFEEFQGQLEPDQIQLFHARFALCDRLAIQADVLARFGKKAGPEDRRGRLLIATQVVEQSLDVDFDLVFSDLAPIDLLLQRDGRQMRHRRRKDGSLIAHDNPDPDERGAHLFTVATPEWDPEPQSNWYSQRFPRAARVYSDQAHLLWNTHKMLREHPVISLPEDARLLVEAVYDSPELPEALQNQEMKRLGTRYSHRALADTLTYDPQEGYDGSAFLSDNEEVNTRLGLDQKKFALAIWDGEKLVPYANQLDFPWFHSQVAIHRDWFTARETDALAPEAKVLEQEKVNRDHVPILPVQRVGEVFQATVRKGEQRLVFTYDPLRGARKPQSNDSPRNS